MNRHAHLLIGLFLMTSCGFYAMNRAYDSLAPIPKSHKLLDIPRYPDGKPFVYWNFAKQKEEQLGLMSPEFSSDSLLFRIWITVPTRPMNQQHMLFEMVYSDSTWTGKGMFMLVDFNSSRIRETIRKHQIIPLEAKNGWHEMADTLFRYQIDKLPTDERLPFYDRHADYSNNLTTISFEYATSTFYRFYQYNNPAQLQEHFWQAEYVIKMLDYIDSETGLDSLGKAFYE
jgi:hypothetical protein